MQFLKIFWKFSHAFNLVSWIFLNAELIIQLAFLILFTFIYLINAIIPSFAAVAAYPRDKNTKCYAWNRPGSSVVEH